MEKSKILLLIETDPKVDIFFNDWIDRGYNASVIFKKVNKLARLFRRFYMNKRFNPSIWLNGWLKELNKYDAVILHMSYLTRYLPLYLIKKNPKLKVICWYWNTIDEKNKPISFENKNIEYWSFDKSDCEKYGFKQNIQYYCNQNNMENNIDNDVYFIGLDKGRKKEIEKLKVKLEKKDIKCQFDIIQDNGDFVPYYEVKENIRKSKAILDIVKDNQIGFTLRVLESLFFEKKLITNNKYIKESPFYNKQNIFIIGDDNLDDIKDFLESSYDKSVNKYKEKYELDTWINNFFI